MGRKKSSFEAICEELTAAQQAVILCRANLNAAALAPGEREWLLRKVSRYTVELNRLVEDLTADEVFNR